MIDVSILEDKGIQIKRMANGYVLLPAREPSDIMPEDVKKIFIFESVFDLSQAVTRWAEYKAPKSKKDKK